MGEMSRYDEIMEVLNKYKLMNDTTCREYISDDMFDDVVMDIEKLFEVEGEVKYIVQWINGSKHWIDDNALILRPEILKATKDVLAQAKLEYPEHDFQIIKRTTTDEVVA